MKTELRILLESNLIVYKEYEYTCKYIENKNFKHFLKAYSIQRLKNANDIKTELDKRNISYHTRTNIVGDLHQSVISGRNAISEITDLPLLQTCIRREHKAKWIYEKILKSNVLNFGLQRMCIQHLNHIKAATFTLTKLAPIL